MNLTPNNQADAENVVWLQKTKGIIEEGRRQTLVAQTNLKTLKEKQVEICQDARQNDVVAEKDEDVPEAIDKTLAELDAKITADKSEAERYLNMPAAPIQG